MRERGRQIERNVNNCITIFARIVLMDDEHCGSDEVTDRDKKRGFKIIR